SIMTDSEISWINDYHGLVRSKLSPELDETARQWLTEKTRPLTR
ncbi:MAG: M24 family metallopeptidase C-terminal domain-containing protein, partial [Paramuribaculum sp.]|nr:M24 family metallopeptidase C-terminal domain-containing protein [Paramuribaculum sp.]